MYARIDTLRHLHEKGFKTWVSIEPYPTPNIVNQELKEILDKISFADKIVFGRLNYSSKVKAYPNAREFYNDQAQAVTNMLGEQIKIREPLSLIEKRSFMKLPVEERRKLLSEQADRFEAYYRNNPGVRSCFLN